MAVLATRIADRTLDMLFVNPAPPPTLRKSAWPSSLTTRSRVIVTNVLGSIRVIQALAPSIQGTHYLIPRLTISLRPDSFAQWRGRNGPMKKTICL